MSSKYYTQSSGGYRILQELGAKGCKNILLPPATKLGQGNIFTSVCQEFCSRGVCSWGCLLPGGCLVWGDLVPGGACSMGVPAPRGGAWWRPPRTATAAGGTHPTGMHSCIAKFLPKTASKRKNYTGCINY